MPYLIVQFRGGREQRVPLDKNPTVLGRGAGCDFQINDPKASREHCQVSEHEGQWTLQDLDSRNQTWMGLQPITEVLLSDGDQFRIGATHIVFRADDDPTQVFEDKPDWS